MKKTFLISYIIWPFYLSKALAIQTQVNEVTDLFDKHIENKDSLLLDMKKQTDNAYGLIQSGQHHDSIEGIDKAEGKTNELNSIKETDLETSGRQKRLSKEYQFYDENELEPDYTKSANLMHKSDAEDIISATEKTMSKLGTDLKKKLIELGFNCKTIKGAIHKESTYYIEIKKEEQNNIKYDQFFCEEPKDQYSCNDSVSLNCIKKGMQWGLWQARTVDIVGSQVYWEAKHLGYAVHWKRKRWGWHLNFGKQYEWRSYLSSKLGIPLEQISEAITFPSGNWGGSVGEPPVNIGEEYRHVYPYYRFGYFYREGREICEQWAEDWTERCVLK